MVINQIPTRSLTSAAAPMGLHCRTIWNILRQDLNLHLYKLQMHKISMMEICWIWSILHNIVGFVLRNDFEFSSKSCVPMSVSFHFTDLGTVKLSDLWFGAPRRELEQVRQNSPSIVVWWSLSKKEIGAHFVQNKTVSGENYKGMLRHYAFPRLREYPEDIIFHLHGAHHYYPILYVSIWGKRSQIAG